MFAPHSPDVRLMVTPTVASLALVASISVVKTRNLRLQESLENVFSRSKFHKIVARYAGRIVVSTVTKGVTIIAKGVAAGLQWSQQTVAMVSTSLN